MIDYNSVESLDVVREGQKVAVLHRLPKGFIFRYESSYFQTGQAPIALRLPLDSQEIQGEGIANLPTYFAGLLPEGVMSEAVLSRNRLTKDNLFACLAATGFDAIGDVDVRVPGENRILRKLNLEEAKKNLQDLRSAEITALPGVQKKLSIGELARSSRGASYIVKVSPSDLPGLVENEFAVMTLARKVGLSVAEVKLNSGALLVKRFDRPDPRPHLEDMLQIMDRYPSSKYSYEYRELLEAMARLGTGSATLLKAIELYAFSYLVGNGDLHEKNVSMIRKPDGQWVLSPAYDLLSTLPYADQLLGADRMVLALADEAHGKFSVDDFIQVGSSFRIPPKAMILMLRKLCQNIAKHASKTLAPYIAEPIVDAILDRTTTLLADATIS